MAQQSKTNGCLGPPTQLVLAVLLFASSHALLVVPVPAVAQPGQPEWLSLDGSPPGSPPIVEFLRDQSNAGVSVFEIRIPGFYRQTINVPPNVFDRIWLPEGGYLDDPGKPSIPVVPLFLGLVTGDSISVQVTDVEIVEIIDFPDWYIYPAQIHQPDTPENPPHPPFQFDEQFYSMPGPYPFAQAAVMGPSSTWRRIRVQLAQARPFRTVPSIRLLSVAKIMRVTIAHPGPIQPRVPVTRRAARTILSRLDNADTVGPGLLVNDLYYDGCFLFITDDLFVDAIQPLVRQKRELGYKTTVLTTDQIGGRTCSYLLTAVQDWYQDCADQGDAYVLLVGDIDYIDICRDPYFSLQSDYILGSIDYDIYAEIGVGRLSVDSETDCEEQVTKILAYEDSPWSTGNAYAEVELVASEDHHQQNGLAEFEDALEAAAAQSFSSFTPNFTKRYGAYSTGTVANVLSDINSGRGIVMYDGHANSSSWASWDYNGASLTTTDVRGLSNGDQTPIVMSLACRTSQMYDVGDCFAETFMEGETNGAVGHFGSLRNSYRCHNHLFASSFFRVLYRDDTPIIADVLQCANFDALGSNSAESHSEHTIWQNQWLGDPSMIVWRENPYGIVISDAPIFIEPGNQILGLRILTGAGEGETGEPVEGAIVALYKDGEVFINAYSDADGWVNLPIEPTSPGTLTARVYTDFGNARGDRIEIPVGASSGVPVDSPVSAFRRSALLGVSPNPFNPQATIDYFVPEDGLVRLTVRDAAGRPVATLVDGIMGGGRHAVRWDGHRAGGGRAATGVYFLRLDWRGEARTGKIILIK